MIYKKGEMWDALDEADLFLVTTNSTIKKDGSLVMGRGMALQAKNRFKDLDVLAGRVIVKKGLENSIYGILMSFYFAQPNLGLFQSKIHYSDMATANVIQRSANTLRIVVRSLGLKNVHLNFPGIGNGRLDAKYVIPVLEEELDSLPVTIWRKE